MYGPAPDRGPLTPQERWFCGIFLAIVLGLLVAEICYNYEPVKLSALLVVVFWVPLLALHEAGHALAAALVGWHVRQVVIGMGRIVGRFRVGSAAVEVRLFPIEGFVLCAPKKLSLPHLKSAFIYFAGPGVELLLALAILFIVGPERLLTRSQDYLVIVWQSLALASTAQAVLNLIPAAIWTPRGIIANDGLGILRSFFLPEEYYARMIGTSEEPEEDPDASGPADWWKRRREHDRA
jgi:hypothetical protein